ncbi:hypothetical protein, partial [Okeania sp. SIO2B9]
IIFFVGLIPHRLHGVQNYLGLESPCNFPPVSCLLSPVSFFNHYSLFIVDYLPPNTKSEKRILNLDDT